MPLSGRLAGRPTEVVSASQNLLSDRGYLVLCLPESRRYDAVSARQRVWPEGSWLVLDHEYDTGLRLRIQLHESPCWFHSCPRHDCGAFRRALSALRARAKLVLIFGIDSLLDGDRGLRAACAALSLRWRILQGIGACGGKRGRLQRTRDLRVRPLGVTAIHPCPRLGVGGLHRGLKTPSRVKPSLHR